MTLNGVMALILRYFTEFASVRGTLRTMVENIPELYRHKCSPNHVDFSDISLLVIIVM